MLNLYIAKSFNRENTSRTPARDDGSNKKSIFFLPVFQSLAAPLAKNESLIGGGGGSTSSSSASRAAALVRAAVGTAAVVGGGGGVVVVALAAFASRSMRCASRVGSRAYCGTSVSGVTPDDVDVLAAAVAAVVVSAASPSCRSVASNMTTCIVSPGSSSFSTARMRSSVSAGLSHSPITQCTH
jgi:hypothetical protein